MKRLMLGLLLCGTAVAGEQAAAPVSTLVEERGAAGTVMEVTFTTRATPERVWEAIATGPGLAQWAAPAAYVDLRPGGAYELYYKPDAPAGKRGMEGNKVLGFVPGRMIGYSGGLPDTWAVYLIERHSGRTQVAFIAMGTHPDWKAKAGEHAAGVTSFVQKLANHLAQP
jgi:uncharacterized protein YndB with AHSA1/START domain